MKRVNKQHIFARPHKLLSSRIYLSLFIHSPGNFTTMRQVVSRKRQIVMLFATRLEDRPHYSSWCLIKCSSNCWIMHFIPGLHFDAKEMATWYLILMYGAKLSPQSAKREKGAPSANGFALQAKLHTQREREREWKTKGPTIIYMNR